MVAVFADLVLLILVAVVGHSEAALSDQLVVPANGESANDMALGWSDCLSELFFDGRNVACQLHVSRIPDSDLHSQNDYVSAPNAAAGAKFIREPRQLLQNMSRAAVVSVTFSLLYSLFVLFFMTFASYVQVRITLGVFNFVMISGAIFTGMSATLIILVHEYTIITGAEMRDDSSSFLLLCCAIVSHSVSALLILNTDMKKKILMEERHENDGRLCVTC
ncbi:hypothetical protein CLIB1423_28S00980 [[Candida] railenensis]|uniref:Uncharacterized protein n=1 Tax=[Candida] railenensis TaxID=45579 RepID=A0A9P0QTV5_9ASCO|nr:hypothetical protein CLIB1423_28S00980 [[Candida] railenensis]